MYTFFSVRITLLYRFLIPHASSLASTPTSMVCLSTPFCLLLAWSIPCPLFEILVGFSFDIRERFCWGLTFRLSALATHCNLYKDYSMLLSSLWNLTVLLLLYYRTFFPEWCHLLLLSVIRVNLGGLPPPETHPQNLLIMSRGQQGTSNNQLHSSI